MISEIVNDWSKHKVFTTVENIETTLRDIDFPAVTVCHESQYQPDNWALPEMILNSFSLSDCLGMNNQKLCGDIKSLLKDLYKEMKMMIEQTVFLDGSLEKAKLISHSTVKLISQAILANLTSIDNIDKAMENSIGTFATMNEFIESEIPKVNQYQKCMVECNKLIKKVRSLVLRLTVIFSDNYQRLGTFLRQNVRHLGLTFDDENVYKTKNIKKNLCNKFLQIETHIHETMLEAGKALGLNASVFDIPSLMKESNDFYFGGKELRQNFPMFTLCKTQLAKSDKNLPYCKKYWLSIRSNTSHYNPKIKLDPKDFCHNGTHNLLGSNSQLPELMRVMKFAYHLATYNETLNVYKKLNYESNESKTFAFLYETTHKRNFILQHDLGKNVEKYFKPVITSNGLCYAWNNKNVNEVFKKSNYIDLFNDVFDNGSSKRTFTKAAKKVVVFYLDAHTFYLPDRMSNKKSFRFAIFINVNFYKS